MASKRLSIIICKLLLLNVMLLLASNVGARSLAAKPYFATNMKHQKMNYTNVPMAKLKAPARGDDPWGGNV